MRNVLAVALAVVAAGAAIVVYAVLRGDAESGDVPLAGLTVAATVTPRPTATPLPASWAAGLEGAPGAAEPASIVCRDVNGDLRLDAGDGLAGLEIALEPARCGSSRADEYRGGPETGYGDCAEGPARGPSVLIWAVASAGTDLRDPSSGESLGVLAMLNDLRAGLAEAGMPSRIVLSASALYGAIPPQTSMEHWVAHQLAAEMDVIPCLRAVVIGHSHGGATVTSVTSALDGVYADRMLGVLIDRTVALYDRPASELPARARLLNFYQTNEGWHGDYIAAANVINSDESSERAPVALSDGGGGFALVSHKTLDDAPGAQRRMIDGIIAWLQTPPAAPQQP